MKKRLFSLCVSVCLAVVAGTSMSSTAYYYENDVDEVGDMISIYHDMLNGVVVQTDGTVPDAADFEKYESFSNFTTWAEYYDSPKWEGTVIDELPSENTYLVWCKNFNEDEISKFGRQLVCDLDYIENIYFANFSVTAPVYREDAFWVVPKEGVILDETSIPELNEFYCESWGEDVGSSAVQYTFVGDKEATDLFSGDSEAWDVRSLEAYLMWEEYAETILENHSDILESVSACRYGLEDSGETTGYSTPIWQTAGDHNADGEVNSNDAADLLVQAAQDGVAEASETAVSPDSDVNLDGVADSTDAAYILQYAALKGSGADADWVEILK